MDMNSLRIAETTVLHLDHPVTGEKMYDGDDIKKPVTITLASTSSRAYRSALAAMHNRTLKRGNKRQTPQEIREEGIELLTKVCISSTHLAYNGEEVQTEQAFRELLSDDGLSWIKTQVDTALGEVSNFIKQ